MRMRVTGLAICGTALLLCAGCLESPFAPRPQSSSGCGAASNPCPLDCGLACLGRVVDVAATCSLTLQGRLSADRTRCDFDDGSVVSFRDPLPADPAAANTLSFSIERDGSPCVSASLSRGIELVTTELSIGGDTLRQRALFRVPTRDGGADSTPDDAALDTTLDATDDARATDGGPSDVGVDAPPRATELVNLELRCPDDGKSYRADGTFCQGCEGGCKGLALLRIEVSYQGGSVTLGLSGADRTVALASCQ